MNPWIDAVDDPEQAEQYIRDAIFLSEVLDVVRNGGTITLTGSGPLCPGSPRYTARMQSHTGARYVGSTGEDLLSCLKGLVEEWNKL